MSIQQLVLQFCTWNFSSPSKANISPSPSSTRKFEETNIISFPLQTYRGKFAHGNTSRINLTNFDSLNWNFDKNSYLIEWTFFFKCGALKRLTSSKGTIKLPILYSYFILRNNQNVLFTLSSTISISSSNYFNTFYKYSVILK